MKTTEKQLQITRIELDKFNRAICSFNMYEAIQRTGSQVLAQLEIDALRSEAEILEKQLKNNINL